MGIVVQNVGPYDWDFNLYEKGSVNELTGRGKLVKTYTINGIGHPKENIALIPEEHWATLLEQYPQIYDLLKETNKKGLRILPEVPSNYYDAQHFLGIERTRANALQSRVTELAGAIAEKDAEIERLNSLLKGYGHK